MAARLIVRTFVLNKIGLNLLTYCIMILAFGNVQSYGEEEHVHNVDLDFRFLKTAVLP